MTPTVQTEPTTPITMEGYAPLAAALARFQSEMPTVPKTKTADTGTYRYSYADLAAITSAALPLLTAQGLSFATCPRYTEHGYELVGVLLHESGESMEGTLPIHGSSAQQLGSAITYARRYLFGCMTGVVTDDDDDGQSASGKPARTPRKKAADREPNARTSGGASVAQVQKIAILMGELGLNSRAAAQQYVAEVTGRQVESRNDLTGPEAHAVIEALQTRGVNTPVGPTGEGVPPSPEPAPVEGPTGPPDPPGPSGEGEYRFAGVEEHPLPEPPEEPPTDPFAETLPVAPPARINASALRRIKAFLKVELGEVATEAEEVALCSAILGYPVASVESLTAPEGQQVARSLMAFGDGSLRWEFDPNDTSPTPAIIIAAPPAADE